MNARTTPREKMSGFSMRGGIEDPRPLPKDMVVLARLDAARSVLRVLDGREGGEALAERCWNTIMDIACGSGERKPFTT